ncbi:MAG: hypothetical protein KF865_08630 [Bdellovibrionaceae bacterium]|nr:hypothetical protein [Pseudobdellovibrionaceae bacterium]
MGKVTSAAEAIGAIRSGQKVFVHGAAATPNLLIEALVARAADLRDVELIHLHTEGPAPYANADLKSSFRVLNLFVGANMRRRLDYETNDYLPCFLSEIPALFRKGRQKIDVALLHLSPPDENGFCSLGVSVDVIRGASLSEGGKPIIALPSRTKHGKPRIVAELQPGAGVVTTRAHTHYVVTEYGVADLYGRSLHERCRALIDIAHPEDREDLRRQWRASHS